MDITKNPFQKIWACKKKGILVVQRIYLNYSISKTNKLTTEHCKIINRT